MYKSFHQQCGTSTLGGHDLRTMCGVRGTAPGRCECCRRQLMRGIVRLLQDLCTGGKKTSQSSILTLIPNAAALAAVRPTLLFSPW